MLFNPGEWYLAVTCEECKTRFPFLRDLSKGTSDVSGGTFFLTCPLCNHETHYRGNDQVERYFHPETETSD
jgi:hypothetical protein